MGETKEKGSLEILSTSDGSSTVYVPWLDETYHSRRGAITESRYIYIDHGLANRSSDSLCILEIGFGTGLNALLTYLYALETGKFISYHTFEPFPLSEGLVNNLQFDDLFVGLRTREVFERMHKAESGSDIRISREFMFRLDCLAIERSRLQESYFDVVYYDAFAPSRQPEIWDKAVLSLVHKAMKKRAVLVTYCAQGKFKRDLREIGFETEHPPGPLGKKEMTVAVK